MRDLEIVYDCNYAQVLTMSIVRQGYRLKEISIVYLRRRKGESFIVGKEYLRKVFPAIWQELRTRRTKKRNWH